MSLDFGPSVSRHIPVDTARVSERDLLVAIAQLMTEQLAATKHLVGAFERLSVNGESGGEERLPSITVEDMAKGEPKVTSKSYGDKPLTRSLIDEHLAAHAYAKRLANELQMRQWSDTAAMVANGERP